MPMMSRTSSTPAGALLFVELDRLSITPLSEQIYISIRRAIEAGRLPAGVALPASRALAGDLGVARSTVTLAFEHLRKEGYIEGSAGRANRVARQAPQLAPGAGPQAAIATAMAPLSRRSRTLRGWSPEIRGLLGKRPRAFRPAAPALDLFPVDLWHRLLSRAWRRTLPQALSYGDLLGFPPLRQAIAEYLQSARGLTCSAENIVVCGGSQQAFDVCARLVLDPGDAAWVEDPGYIGAQLAVEASGGAMVPVPVDEEGLDVEAGRRAAPHARLACVSPARQHPLGHSMSPARRRALLAWAASAGAWIVEDDYDAELRYGSVPLQPLLALDTAGCVIMAGSFSKVLLPALRLGFMVVPAPMGEFIRRLRMATDVGGPMLPQAVLADFISGGHFARHVRRLRAAYQERHELLLEQLGARLGGSVKVLPALGGFSLSVLLPEFLDDREVARRGADFDLELAPLSITAIQHPLRPGLFLGFGGLAADDIRQGVERLARLLASFGVR